MHLSGRQACLLNRLVHLRAGKVEAAIRSGGLAQTKTERIKAILAALLQERGELSLEYIRSLPDEAIKTELSRCGLSVHARAWRALN
jgi:endonuclease III